MDSLCDSARAEMLAALPRIRRFALALAGNIPDADDLVQDTIERALGNFDKWSPGTRMDSWMFRIAQNLWIDTVRSRTRRSNFQRCEEENGPHSYDGERAVEASLNLSQTQRALLALPNEQRVIIALILLEGLSYREAASILNIPIGTVTSRLARARDALAERVFGHSVEGEE
jgi:RNA polymerase sigma-70 factor (ECF subfamily)